MSEMKDNTTPIMPDYGKLNEEVEKQIYGDPEADPPVGVIEGHTRKRVFTPQFIKPGFCDVCANAMAKHYQEVGKPHILLCDSPNYLEYPEVAFHNNSLDILKPSGALHNTTYQIGTLMWGVFLWVMIFVGVMMIAMSNSWAFLTAVLWGVGTIATAIAKDVYARMTEREFIDNGGVDDLGEDDDEFDTEE